eukprot:m51a1_g2706 hypothetical protein (243) ;mRNA; r:815016-816014
MEEWWNRQPRVTRTILAAMVVVSLSLRFGIVSARYLIYIPSLIFIKMEMWRLVTPFLTYKLDFGALIQWFMFLRHAGQLESVEFVGRTADFIWMFILSSVVILIGGALVGALLLGSALTMVAIYVWARAFPDTEVTFMFGLRFKSIYLPWVLVAFNFVLGGSPVMELIGILAGHLYFFFWRIAPITAYSWLGAVVRAPLWLRALVPEERAAGIHDVAGGFQARAAPAQQQRHDWGRGRALDD